MIRRELLLFHLLPILIVQVLLFLLYFAALQLHHLLQDHFRFHFVFVVLFQEFLDEKGMHFVVDVQLHLSIWIWLLFLLGCRWRHLLLLIFWIRINLLLSY